MLSVAATHGKIDRIGRGIEAGGKAGWRGGRCRVERGRDVVKVTRQRQVKTATKSPACRHDLSVGLNSHSLRQVAPAGKVGCQRSSAAEAYIELPSEL